MDATTGSFGEGDAAGEEESVDSGEQERGEEDV
jgi:hypothetical protein